MVTYKLRNVPDAHDWKGNFYPAHVELVLVCSRGLRWHGGDFVSREAAIAAGDRATRKAA